ncbi:MAG: YbaK/EbsC family protein [Rhabdochlamydiaceae bacterium]|nr:YbaK/EbsC family protein [Rhabdochlamydiaceae bacterium]
MSDTKLDQLDKILKENNTDYSIYIDSVNVKSAQEGADLYNIHLSETTPTLILKTKEKYYAAIICGNRRLSFKKLKQALKLQSVSMADPQIILALTGARVGEISLINHGMTTLVDIHVLKNINCYGGCGVPNKTLRINTQDLIRITHAEVLDFSE